MKLILLLNKINIPVLVIILLMTCIMVSCSGPSIIDKEPNPNTDQNNIEGNSDTAEILEDTVIIRYGETSEFYGDPQNVRQMYAWADLVVKCKVLNTDISKHDKNNLYYIPMSIAVEKVYKGNGADEGSVLDIAAVGGVISQTEYRENINKKYIVSDTSDGKVILTVGDKKDILIPERSYILCLTYIPDVEEDGPIPAFPFRYVPINGIAGFYEITEAGVYVGSYDGQQAISSKDEFLANIADEAWLTYVEKPSFAKEITYVPADTKVSLVSSQSKEDLYYMCYSSEKSEEFPLGVAYHIRQAPFSGEATLDFYKDLVDEFEFITLEYIDIKGINVKYYEFNDIPTASKTLYFVYDGIEYSIDGVCVPDITELVKIAESFID